MKSHNNYYCLPDFRPLPDKQTSWIRRGQIARIRLEGQTSHEFLEEPLIYLDKLTNLLGICLDQRGDMCQYILIFLFPVYTTKLSVLSEAQDA